jgi:hypothetical protein
MKTLTRLPLMPVLLLFALLGLSSCIYVNEPGPEQFFPTADLEVRVATPSGFVVQGAEISLYASYQDALGYRFPIARGWTDGYGVMCFHELPVGQAYFVRAQGNQLFSLGQVFLEHPGLWVLPMELY